MRTLISAVSGLSAFTLSLLVGTSAPAAEDNPTGGDTPAVVPAAGQSSVENSVVKVFATTRHPDLPKPWTKHEPRETSGTGIVIEGKRILTNAHVVIYASQIQIQANQSGDKLSATVEYTAPGIDLAVLKLDDESFFDSHPPLRRADALPQIKDTVLVYGYPTGGTSLSITKGIVSRIEFANYNYPVSGLRVQIDAAINPGNSGGPALVGDKVIGLAYSHLTNAQNIGYIIPAEEIALFLKDIADGHYDGKPALYDDLQTLENPALRTFLKLDKAVQGIVMREPYRTDPAYPLKPWDVITRIGDTPVDVQGMVKVGDNLRIRFTYLIQQIAKDGQVTLSIVRAGKESKVQVPVAFQRPKLLPFLHGNYPSYFIYGPLVFAAASDDFVASLTSGTNGATANTVLSHTGSPLVARRGDKPAFDGEELVVVPSPFFPHKLSKGYSSPVTHVVQRVNGIAIRNLAHLVTVLRDCRDEFVVVDFAERTAETVVLPRDEARAATEEILTDNGVRAQGSPDMLEVWNAKPGK